MKTFIFGYSRFAELIKFYIENDSKYEWGGYILDEEFIPPRSNNDFISWKSFKKTIDPRDCQIIVVIGYSGMNSLRQTIFERLHGEGYNICQFIHPSAQIASNTKLGCGSIVLEDVVIEPFVQCGDGNIFWSKSNICHHTNIGNYNFFAASSTVLGMVTIRNNCFFGANCTVKNKVIVNDRTLVGAAAYVSKDTNIGDVIVPNKSIVLDKKSGEIKI